MSWSIKIRNFIAPRSLCSLQTFIFVATFIAALVVIIHALVSRQPVVDETKEIRNELLFAWKSYKAHAWGENELSPVTRSANMAADARIGKGVGVTIIESVGSLYLMGFLSEYMEAKDWILKNLDFSSISNDVRPAEISSKVLGGLLSAFTLTEEPGFLRKAIEVAEGIIGSFDTSTGLPAQFCPPFESPTFDDRMFTISAGNIGQFYLEFSLLSELTSRPVYRDLVVRAKNKILPPIPKPLVINEGSINTLRNYVNISLGWNVDKGPVTSRTIKSFPEILGEKGFHFVEALLKDYLLFNNKDSLLQYRLLTDSLNHNANVCVTLGSTPDCLIEQLSCEYVELLAIGMPASSDPITSRRLASRITEICYQSATSNELHLPPEVFQIKTNGKPPVATKKEYLPSPSVFVPLLYMWHMTRDPDYKTKAKELFNTMITRMKLNYGYSGFRVESNGCDLPSSQCIKYNNNQPSFFLGKTLKYLYLFLDPSKNALFVDEWIFNSQGHPFPKQSSSVMSRLKNIYESKLKSDIKSDILKYEQLRLQRSRQTATIPNNHGVRTSSISTFTVLLGLLHWLL